MLNIYLILLLFASNFHLVISYTNKHYTIMKEESYDFQCGILNRGPFNNLNYKLKGKQRQYATQGIDPKDFRYATINTKPPKLRDPVNNFEKIIQQVVYGRISGGPNSNVEDERKDIALYEGVDLMAHLPTGGAMRAEIFHNKSAVHMPFLEYMHRGHAYLKITRDHMQTAVNAFAIFIGGTLEDIMRLPAPYVLRSARTIAMMRVAKEKLATTWLVVKGSTPTENITYETLEQFRPLFKYINGKEMARLNLLDNKILTFIGTHAELSRHQMGVVASRYIQLNRNWTQARYLNMMNNLLCGVPIYVMRRIPRDTYLQLTHQVFYHTRACDPLQRKFYLQMMTRTQALGRSYSWSAREVSRLGLLLCEVDGPSLGAINPEAMAGITSQVMLEMSTENLKYITEMQLRYLEPKCLNIIAKKLLHLKNDQDLLTSGYRTTNLLKLALIALCIFLCQVM